MRHAGNALLSAIISVSLVASSTAAAASSAPPPPPAPSNPWMTLSLLTSTSAPALGAASVAAAQTEAPQPPPQPPTVYDRSGDTTLLFFGSVLILAAILALAVSQGDNDEDDSSPV